MALPAVFNLRNVVAHYYALDGSRPSGKVTFVTTTFVGVPSAKGIIIPKPLVGTVVAGELSVDLPITNDPDVDLKFVYKVTEELDGLTNREPYIIEVPAGTGAMDLYGVMPAAPVDPAAAYLTMDYVRAFLRGVVIYDYSTNTWPSRPAGRSVEWIGPQATPPGSLMSEFDTFIVIPTN